jgi:DNA processing protein
MKELIPEEIELILYAETFQRRFHGVAALDLYIENIRRVRQLISAGRTLRPSFFVPLGISTSDEALLLRRQEIVALAKQGVCFIYPGHPDYPQGLLRIAEPPFLLSYIGQPIWKSLPGLAVVGSREPAAQSLEWMGLHLGDCLERRNFFVASGGARGVDQKAHGLALLKARPTLVFVPSGLGNLYPQSLGAFVGPVLKGGGAVVSEYGFLEPMRKHYFHARNRLISGFSECTLIVQASRKSGTLITGRQALEQSRPVFVVPSHPLDIGFQGGLDLLVEGATPVRDCADLLLLLDCEMKNHSGWSVRTNGLSSSDSIAPEKNH